MLLMLLVLVLLILIQIIKCDNTIDLRIISVDDDDEYNISIKGYGFGTINDDVNISIGNKTCSNIEICSTICQSCQYKHCSSDSVCIITKDKGAHCFMPCSGINDSSCPCNTFCDSVRVHSLSTGKSSLLNLCTPRRLLSDDICGDYNTDRINCKPDKGAIMSSSSSSSSSSSLPPSSPSLSSLPPSSVSYIYETRLTVNTNTTTFSSSLALSLSSCDTTSDCYDGSICSVDTCIQGQCYSTTINTTDTAECSKYTMTNNKGSDTFYGYLSYINDSINDANNDAIHFANYLVSHGTRSTTSDVDDYPTEEILLPFSFLYFGTIISSISINPNGVLLLPPLYDCHNVINSVSSSECIVYATDSNTISLWATDWDLSRTTTSSIYYYHQAKGDSSQLWGLDQTAFHVLYSNVHRYQANNTKSTATFAASIYTDGSIHISYLHKDIDIMDIDVFGLWGTRASQYHSNLRYHEEKIAPSLIKNGTNIYYCNIETIGCIEEACVSPDAFVSIRWKKTSCHALADLSYSCVFGDGLAETTPMFSEADKNVLLCPVPVLPVKDGAIIELSIKMTSSNTVSTKITIIRSITLANYELTQSRMTIKYSSTPQRCGCSSFHSDLKCDTANVCGGRDDIADCFGTPFGSAYFDGCSKCSGGLSGLVPKKCFDVKDDLKIWFSEVISFTMLLCFMSFALASFYVIFARMTSARQNLIFRESIRNEAREHNRGLTTYELECISEQEYTEEFFNNISNEDEFNSTECSICLGKFKDKEHVRLLPSPCRHVFHISCIDEWFKLSTSCPLCKRNIRYILEGGNGYEEDVQNRESVRLSRVSRTEAMQILFNRVQNQTTVNRGLLELRRMINRGGNARPNVNFSQIPQNEEV